MAKSCCAKCCIALIAILVSGGIAFGVLWTQYKCQIKNGFKAAFKLGKAVNSVGQECFEIVKAPKKCSIFGESNPSIGYWVKGDGCCEVKKEESELCDPVDADKKTTTKAYEQVTKPTTKPTDKPKTKPSTNDVDSDWTSWSSSSDKNPSSWNLPDASDFNREPDINDYKPPKIPDIQNFQPLRPVRPG